MPEEPFSPGDPLFTPPGSQFSYTGASMDMFTNALTRAAEEPLQQLFDRRIAQPIGMDPDKWEWGEFVADDGVVVDGGAGFPGRGFSTSASNAARLGLLFLNRGNWDGQQILSSDWVDAATQVQVPPSVPLHPQSATTGPGEYGLGWWVTSDGWFHAIGNQNNYISANPTLEMVLVTLGTQSGGIPFNTYATFRSRINSVVMSAMWDEQGDGAWGELNPATGQPRWTTESGIIPDIYPTTSAMIRKDTVTVAQDLAVRRVDVVSGGLHVGPEAELKSTGRIELDEEAEFVVEGTLDAKVVHVGEGSTLVLEGESKFDQLRVQDSTLRLHDVGAPYSVQRWQMLGDSHVQFVVSDASWDSTVLIAARPTFSGELSVEFSSEWNLEELEGQTLTLFEWGDRAPSHQFTQITMPPRVDGDLSQFYSTGEITINSVLDKPSRAGDFNGDQVLDNFDIDELSGRIRHGTQDTYYDVDGDEFVAVSDLEFWIEELGLTTFGDTNLDRQVGFEDFLIMSSNFGGAGGWNQGDFDADGFVGFADFLILSKNFGHGTAVVSSVPEPRATPLAILGCLFVVFRRNVRASST